MFSMAMTKEFLSTLNILAVLVSTILFFGLGFVWYSMLFGKAWVEELKKHGVTIKDPDQSGMIKAFAVSIICSFLIAFGMAFIDYHAGVATWMAGLKMGIAISVFLGLPIIGLGFNWEGKSMKLFMIDASYTTAGIILSAVICGVWR